MSFFLEINFTKYFENAYHFISIKNILIVRDLSFCNNQNSSFYILELWGISLTCCPIVSFTALGIISFASGYRKTRKKSTTVIKRRRATEGRTIHSQRIFLPAVFPLQCSQIRFLLFPVLFRIPVSKVDQLLPFYLMNWVYSISWYS